MEQEERYIIAHSQRHSDNLLRLAENGFTDEKIQYITKGKNTTEAQKIIDALCMIIHSLETEHGFQMTYLSDIALLIKDQNFSNTRNIMHQFFTDIDQSVKTILDHDFSPRDIFEIIHFATKQKPTPTSDITLTHFCEYIQLTPKDIRNSTSTLYRRFYR
ncbi:MAG: hypothetical protein ISQ34_00940 [Rickettsiales bacterium]|nr:hypothetical protein [Rickettsiales bacterium]